MSHALATPAAEAKSRACRGCGTEIPAREEHCAICKRRALAQSEPREPVLLHWLVFLAAMAAVFGIGLVIAP